MTKNFDPYDLSGILINECAPYLRQNNLESIFIEKKFALTGSVNSGQNHAILYKINYGEESLNLTPEELVGFTQQFAREVPTPKHHAPEYFTEQAKRLARKPNPGLADALAEFQAGSVDRQFGVDYLRNFVKQDAAISDAELGSYALELDIRSPDSHYGRHFKNRYFDAQFNFCLTYDSQNIACVGFDVVEGRMFIRQIQGERERKNQLKPVKWERALVQYAVKWAERYAVPEVAILSVDNNKWAAVNRGLNRTQGKMLYDVTARRCGFSERDPDGNYVKRLDTREPIKVGEMEAVSSIAA
ncbi:MAG TPA: hypothetical protein VJC21_04915 [Candidatus Nanoarchaeia archaeon]|nr:hypothetical protein [Candidatus Nanoarchaeia archaeon]